MPIKAWGGAYLDVSFAFGSAPFPTSCAAFHDRTWTDVSTSVRYVHIDRGRSHDMDEFAADKAEIILDNRKRLYDPTCSTNTQAGNVIPGCPCRIRMIIPGGSTESTGWARLYSGYAESWSVDYPGMADARVTVKCVSGLRYLQLATNDTMTTADRIDLMVGKVLDAAGWPSTAGGWPTTTGWRNLQTALSTGRNFQGRDAPAAEMCRDLADAEGGAFYVDVTGKVRFMNRHYWVDDMKTNKALFSDSGGTTAIGYTDLKYDCDDYQLYNRIKVKPLHAIGQSTRSTESIDKYGSRTLAWKDLPIGASTESKRTARWLLQRYKDPGIRLSRLETMPQGATGAWPMCSSEIGMGSKITVRRHPPGGGVIASTCHVEGKEQEIDIQNNTWKLTLKLSPAGLQPSTEY